MPSECLSAMKTTEETRVFGAKDKDQPKWQDTNLALFGSDIEYKIKEAAANCEPQWTGAGTKKGLAVWRIEQFKVVPWPSNKYGEFHTGDSYILLSTYCPDPVRNPAKLCWDVHFWIGDESTQDEYGTAAYKTVEVYALLRHQTAELTPNVLQHARRRALTASGSIPSNGSSTTFLSGRRCSTARSRATVHTQRLKPWTSHPLCSLLALL